MQIHNFLLLFAIAGMYLLSRSNLLWAEEITYWTMLGSDRVKPSSQPIANNKSVIIKAAKNEYEPFQIVLRANRVNVKNVTVSVSDLKTEGFVIPKDNIKLYREHYVYVRIPTYRSPNPPGWYPDALIPFRNPIDGSKIKEARFVAMPFDLWDGWNEAIWADVYVPKEAKKGQYHGNITVEADGKKLFVIPIELTVWNFTLPDVPSMKADFGGFSRIAKWHGAENDAEKYAKLEWRYCQAMADHRISSTIPNRLQPKVNPDGSISTENTHEALKKFMEKFHVNCYRINFGRNWPFKDPLNADRQKALRYLNSVYNYLADNGWADCAYTYIIDEPNDQDAYDSVRNYAKLVHEANPNIKFLCTEQTTPQDPNWGDFYGYVDIWVPLWPLHDEENAKKRLHAGDELWSYTALCQGKKESPFWELDFPVLNYRIPMWASWRYKMTGILYWTTVFWAQVKDPWLDQLTYRRRFNSEGSLFYPGTDAGFDGPVTSIRLKNIREGMEDYEYLKILSDLGEKDFADEIARRAVKNWFDWQTDPNEIYRLREIIATKIVSKR